MNRTTTETVDDTTPDDTVDDTTDDATSTDDPFQQAFEAAKEEHSTPEHAPTSEASTDEETEDEPARAVASTRTDDRKAAGTGKTETGLLSDAEFTALQAKHADNPAALRKALEGAFTKKTQTLADERRSVERLQQYTDIIDAYEADPKAAIRLLAKEHGVALGAGDESGDPAPATTETTAETVDAIVDEFKAGLGPELDYLADGLAPAITKLVERLTAKTVEPLKKQHEVLVGKAADEQTATIMQTLETNHPDWKEHEPEMLKLAERIQPAKGMSETEYLEHLYTAVTAPVRVKASAQDVDKRVADGVKAALAKMKRGAETQDDTTRSTPETHVKKAPPGVPSFEEAAAAALRGERWEE